MLLEQKWIRPVQVTERWAAGVETLLGSRLKMAVLKVTTLFVTFEEEKGTRVYTLRDNKSPICIRQVDGRGSEGRGLRWRDSLNIGNTDVADQLQAVRCFKTQPVCPNQCCAGKLWGSTLTSTQRGWRWWAPTMVVFSLPLCLLTGETWWDKHYTTDPCIIFITRVISIIEGALALLTHLLSKHLLK